MKKTRFTETRLWVSCGRWTAACPWPSCAANTAGAARRSTVACRAFDVGETCYRYSPKLGDENEQIADLLLELTTAKKTWGFGLCFLLRNVQGHAWNHKRVYWI